MARKACKLLGIRHIVARWRVLKSGTTPFPVEAPGAKLYLPSLNRSDPPDSILEFSNLAFLRRFAHEALIKHAVLCRHLDPSEFPESPGSYGPQPLIDKLKCIPFLAEAVQCEMDKHKWVLRLA